ncbi:MAG TPA: nicotinate-nucleotide adenylyltransferase [Caproiciproducens sp.]|nr:nicotinate-nucleotide adenylyltransferase [Caproiciproducens sp.]
MQKIAVYGGTFNPIHNGHIHLARQFAIKLGIDRVLLIPTRIPPHKQAHDLASAEDRLEMCRLASQDHIFTVSDMEIHREGPSYTSDTLLELKRQNPGCELYLFMGEDMFITVQDWYQPEILFSVATLCAAPRSREGLQSLYDHARKLEKCGAKTAICNIKFLPISSTMIRNAVKNGKSISGLVSPAVEDYIREKRLYME